MDWGDGPQPEQSTPDLRPFSVKHRYARPGTYHIRAVWTDSSGQSGFRELTIVVTVAEADHDLVLLPADKDRAERGEDQGEPLAARPQVARASTVPSLVVVALPR